MAAKSEKGSGKSGGAKPTSKAAASKTTASKAKAPAPKTTASKTPASKAKPAARKTTTAKAAAPKAPARKTTSTRRKAAPVTMEMIAERAYFISVSGTGGSDHDNWLRAEAELHNGAV